MITKPLQYISIIITATCLAACETSSQSANSGTSSTQSTPTSSDISKCESIIRSFYKPGKSIYDVIPASTHKFSRLLKAAQAPTEPGDEIGYLGYDIITHTQDEAPNIIQFGPSRVSGGQVEVPVVLQFKHYPPNKKPSAFLKTWVFARENGTWLISNVVTSGAEGNNGSLEAELDAHF